MADLKDKYSDERLNKSQQDYDRKFNELTGSPDMRALDDQGNAIARGLKDSENDTDSLGSSSADGSVGSVKQAEENPSDSPDNRFNYRAEKTRSEGRSGWSRRRKLAVGAGAGGGVIAIFASIFALLPLKLPGVLQMITDEAAQRVEQVTEKRAKLIIGRAILTRFGTHTGIVLTGEGAFSTLMASMRTSRFEDRLAAKGLTIESTRDGVRLKFNDKYLAGGKNLKTDTEVLKALEGNRVTNKMLKTLVKEDIPSWRWMKRAKFAKWLRIKYGIPRYGIENDNTEEDEEKRAEAIQKERLEASYDRVTENAIDAFDCVMGEDCVAENVGENSKGDLKSSSNTGDLSQGVEEAGKDLAEKSSKNPSGAVTEKLADTIIGKLGAKAIPIVGWIDLAATLDHIVWEATENDYFAKIPAYFRGLQYAQMYGEWSGYSDQQKMGALDHAIAAPLANQLDGAEESQAFSYIQGDPTKGEPIKLKVNSNNETEFLKYIKSYRSTVGYIPGTPGGQTSHWVMNAWYETIGGGGALGWLSGKLGELTGWIADKFTPDSFQDWIMKYLQKGLGKMMDFFGLSIDPLDAGPDLFNDLHAGATVSSNDFCQNELGCRKLTPEQTATINATIAAERTDELKQKSLAYQLFSPESTKSITTKLAISMPSPSTANIGNSVTKLASLVTNLPSQLGSLVAPQTRATQYVDLYGIDPYGATAADLNKPLSKEFINGEACPETENDKFNDCKADTLTAEAMLCDFQPESEDCSDESGPGTNSGDGIKFTIASYNILQSEHHTGKSIDIGNCSAEELRTDPRCMKKRGDLQAQIIQGGAGNPAFDVVGLQEVAGEQYEYLKQKLPTYDAFPEDTSRINNQKDGSVAIFWNKEKFTKFASGKFPSISNVTSDGTRSNITQPWVGLQAVTGQKIYVTSSHYPISAYGGTPEVMKAAGQYAVDWIKSFAGQDATVFVVGDFNDKLPEKNTYCVLTRNGVSMHARDLEDGLKPGKECPRPTNNRVSIDHIYTTPTEGMLVEKWLDMPNTDPKVRQGSDHTPVYATINFPGESEGTLKIATFNILHVGDSKFEKQWRTRLPTSIGVLKDNGIAVAGLQEVRPQQHDLLTSQSYATDTYDIFPKTSQRPNFSPNPIIWNKSMFKLVSGKTLPIEYDSGNKIDHAVLVKLEDTGGNQFYVLNTHDPANARPGSDEQNALSRFNNAKSYVQKFNELKSEGVPMFLTGDFNVGYTMSGNQKPYQNKAENLTYCVISSGGVMTNVWDIFENEPFKCPRNKTPGDAPIDHIYGGKIDGVSKVWTAKKIENGSDHPTVMAEINVPWAKAGSEGSTTGWVWPLKANINDGPCYGGSKEHAGMDMNSSTSDNPVLAMHAGTVERVGTDSEAGNYITIRASVKFRNKPVYYSYEHLKTGSIPQKLKKGALVKSGEQVGIAGLTGNVSVSSSKAHLHIVTATTNTLGAYGSLGTTFNPMDILKSVKPVPGEYKCYPT